MTKTETRRLIEAVGGDSAFAQLLGIKGSGAVQRVNNWKRRGMPSIIELKHYEKIHELKRSLSEQKLAAEA